ncbi:MAG TPA: hypothetical protein VGH54_10645 [Mycobacterium sp.]|uniref:hypothetical protein n=1 Tax=Mycobacterium sp. TaxID=1785 RepID=UPI002F424065
MADKASVHVFYRCEGCGQNDDHPKLHYGRQQFHHDCTPAFILDVLNAQNLAIVEVAKSGVRGDKLRKHITSTYAGATQEA